MITVAKAFDHFPALIDGVTRHVAKRGGVEAGQRFKRRGIPSEETKMTRPTSKIPIVIFIVSANIWNVPLGTRKQNKCRSV